MNDIVKKITSRKFLVAAAGVISGIVLIASGNVSEGLTAVLTSVIAYLAAEGIIDAVAVKKSMEETAKSEMDGDDYDGTSE